jgi:hypothetical protein
MSTATKSKSHSRRKAGVLLLVGVLAGVTISGGAGVIAASSTKTVTVCANKKSNVLRYAKNGKCTKTETKVAWNKAGTAGAKGDTGAAGVNATFAITQQSVCDGSDTDTIANELCKIGMTGPGGGLIFFVDYNDQHTGLDYLEAAPVGWGNAITVNQGGLTGEYTGSATKDPVMKWCSDTSSRLGLGGWNNSAVGTGGSNTSTADTTCAGGAIQAVSDYAGGTKTDWFLPSVGEAMLMYANLLQVGVGDFDFRSYRTSSEYGDNTWVIAFDGGGGLNKTLKTDIERVRPVRAF